MGDEADLSVRSSPIADGSVDDGSENDSAAGLISGTVNENIACRFGMTLSALFGVTI